FFHHVVVVGGGLGFILVVAVGLAGGRGGMVLLLLGLLAQQRLPVGDRDLVVVGMDLVESEEAVAVAAVLDERRMQRRLNAGHLGEVDVPSKLLSALTLEIE